MRVLLTGANGYLGGALLRSISTDRSEWDLHATFFSIPPADGTPNAHALDLRDPESVARVMQVVQPALIFHTAAVNQSTNAEAMYDTNARGSGYMAREAYKHSARLIHLSSDVIFDGQRGNYSEDDAPNPITPYAVSKAEAEKNVLASGANAVLVRTSLIYGFRPLDPRTRAVMRGEMPRLYTDELRCPVCVHNLCEALIELSELDYRGILHVAGTQALSRYEFGVKLMHALHAPADHLMPARSGQNASPRPLDCTLDVARAQALLKTKLLGVDQVLELTKKK